ncbi:hypothetical protein [Actinomycetospora cinnamomea]|uniref:Uncharacterized protein n=1 Tax=Actinomycetospora cinnamomea TaxID=663609 RepID=A0A2U1EYC7_9PSEU|nr:hypothetical protein [Actinomycetospora cinnamomea]PVZ04933.1 hypothetical protein C8D89_11637 [Actinomycetospora cinnamomea]
MTRLQRLAAATALVGAGSLGLSGVASATESHAHEDDTTTGSTTGDRGGLVTGLVGAGGELAGGVGGLLGGVGGAVGGVLGSDAVGDVVDGLL